MIVGFTGTQHGMTDSQKNALERCLLNLHINLDQDFTGHHGDSIGADAQFHDLLVSYHKKFVIHPPFNDTKRAFCSKTSCLPPKPYLERNKDIVDACQVLIACPRQSLETLRSGTWSTFRYATKIDKPRILILPSGDVRIYGLEMSEHGYKVGGVVFP